MCTYERWGVLLQQIWVPGMIMFSHITDLHEALAGANARREGITGHQ